MCHGSIESFWVAFVLFVGTFSFHLAFAFATTPRGGWDTLGRGTPCADQLGEGQRALLNPLRPSIPPHLLWHLRPGGRQPVFPPAPLSPRLPPAHPQLPPKQGEAPLPTHQPRGRSPKGPRAASPLSSTWPLPKLIPPANPRLVPLALCSRQIPRLQTKRPGGLQGTRLAPSQPC